MDNTNELSEQELEEKKKAEELQKRRKNYTKQGIGIFIGSIVFLALMAVPFCLDFTAIGSTDIVFTFNKLEVIGDGSILGSPATVVFPTGFCWDILGILAVFNFDTTSTTNYTILEILSRAASYLLLAYLLICIFDFFFSFFLIASKAEGLRKFCKVISVISGILLIFFFLLMLVAEVGFIVRIVKLITGGTMPSWTATDYVYFALQNGALFYLIGTLFAFISCVKHFSWYHSAEYDY